MHINTKVQHYLKECFGPHTILKNIQRLGEGIHGVAYLLRFTIANEEKHLIMKTLFPSQFGHDHFSDRAQILLLAHANYNEMPQHVKAVDIVGDSIDRLLSLKDIREFYILMDKAEGEPYVNDLNAILGRRKLTDRDRKRVRELASFLAKIHAVKYTGENSKILYRRRIRDLIGHGECIMGIIDTYERVTFTSDKELIDYAGKCLSWWGKIRNKGKRLCQVHGDFHPGNIWFHGNDITLLDRSRGSWGEAADDVSCLGINYIYYAVRERGTFEGPFAELFRLFLESYFKKNDDYELLELIQPFFAFRILVIANPKFYPDDTIETKKKLLNFGQSVLASKKFETDKILYYLDKK